MIIFSLKNKQVLNCIEEMMKSVGGVFAEISFQFSLIHLNTLNDEEMRRIGSKIILKL